MKNYKYSDFYCLKIQTIPTNIKIKGKKVDYNHPKWREKQNKLVSSYLLFYNLLLKKTLGKDKDFFYINYTCFTRETIREFLQIWHDIYLSESSLGHELIIPKEYKNLIEWCERNKPKSSKVLKRFNIFHINYYSKREFHFANIAFEFSKKNLFEKYPDIYKKQIKLTIEDKPNLD